MQINTFIIDWFCPFNYFLRSYFCSILELIEPITGSLNEDGASLPTRLESVVNWSFKRFDRSIHRPAGADHDVPLPTISQGGGEGDAPAGGDLGVSAQRHVDVSRVRKTLSARQQCWAESFCESGKFLRHAHYWLKNFRIIWKMSGCYTKYPDKSVWMIWKVSGQSKKCPDNL